MANTARPIIKTGGKALPDKIADALVDFRISRQTGAAGHGDFRFDQTVDLGTTFTVGTEIEVLAVEDDDDSTSIFLGEIVSLGIDVARKRTHLVVGASDLSYRLGNQTVAVTHLKKTFGDIIGSIAKSAKLTSQVDSKVASIKFDHLDQTGTPHQFLDHLANKYGCEWRVEGKKLIVERRKAGAPVAKYSGADNLRSFSARFSGVEHAKDVEVRGWDDKTKKPITSKVASVLKSSGNDVPILTKGVKSKLPGKMAVSPRSSAPSAKVAKTLAEGIAGQIESSKLTGRGEVDVNGKIAPGKVVEIDDVSPDWNGKYYVTGVEHVFGKSQPMVTRFQTRAANSGIANLVGNGAKHGGRPGSTNVMIGEVTDCADPEGRHRVKVRYPSVDSELESYWCRVVTAGAGKDRGAMFIPEVGDEVAVAWIEGDPDRAVVLGGLWNGKDTAPDVGPVVKDGKIMSRSITSRKGHELLFSDGDADDDLYVQVSLADKKTFLYLGHTMIEIETKDQPVKITNGKATIELAKNGDITIAGENITIEGKKDVTIKGMNVKIDAKSKFTAEGKSGAELKGKGPVKVESSAITEVKGTMVKIN